MSTGWLLTSHELLIRHILLFLLWRVKIFPSLAIGSTSKRGLETVSQDLVPLVIKALLLSLIWIDIEDISKSTINLISNESRLTQSCSSRRTAHMRKVAVFRGAFGYYQR